MSPSDWIAIVGIAIPVLGALFALYGRHSREIEAVKQKQKAQQSEHNELREEVKKIGEDFSKHVLAMEPIRTDIAVIKGNMATKSEVALIANTVTAVSTNVSWLVKEMEEKKK